MLDTKLQKIAKYAENLELNDLIKIKKVLDDAVAKHVPSGSQATPWT